MIDRYNRKIDYLRLSITDACQLHCKYCRSDCACNPIHMLTLEEIEKIGRVSIHLGITKIRLTGGEPLLHPQIIEIAKALGRLDGLKELTLTTNGQTLSQYADALYRAGIHRINISLDSLKAERYKALTGGDINHVFEGIEAAKRAGMHPIKINVVLLKGINDDEIDAFLEFSKKNDIEVRFIELMPMGMLAKHPELRVTLDDVLANKSKIEMLPYEKGPSRSYQTAKKIPFGMIAPLSHPFCDSCNRIRILSDGVIKLCLGQPEEYSIQEYLEKSDEELEEILKDLILKKPKMHNMQDYQIPKRDMHRIGG